MFNVLQETASQVAALDLGYKAGISNLKALSPKVLYLLGADDSDILKEAIPAGTFVIYQGLCLLMNIKCKHVFVFEVETKDLKGHGRNCDTRLEDFNFAQ